MFKTIFIIILSSFATPIHSQDDLFKLLSKGADHLNKQLLKLTDLSDTEENEIGKELDEKISRDFRFEIERDFKVKNIFEKVKKNIKRDKILYRYSIIDDTTKNAFAIAGGKIYILTGLLDFLENDNEIAFVIAHEIAHIELKHCIRRIQYAAIASRITPSLGSIVQLAYSMYSTPFTKFEEFEADELGVDLMLKAGFKKEGAISFFEKLRILEKQDGQDKRDAINDFISSHPTAEDRIERIKNKK